MYNGPFSAKGHVTYAPLNLIPSQKRKEQEKTSRTAKFEACSIIACVASVSAHTKTFLRGQKSKKSSYAPRMRGNTCYADQQHQDIKFGGSLNIGNGKRICMGKRCWIARLVNQRHFPIQILLVFLRFINTYIFLLFLFLLFTKRQVLNLRVVGHPQLQKAYFHYYCAGVGDVANLYILNGSSIFG